MDNGQSQAKFIDIFFFSTVLGCTSGILWASFFNTPLYLFWIIGGGSLVLLLFSQRNTIVLFCVLFLFSFLIGLWRMEVSKPDRNYFIDSVGVTSTFTGVVSSEPAEKNGNQSFVLKLPQGNLLVSGRASGELSYGDEVSVRGKLEEPENFETAQGMEFDYISYLYKDDILYRTSFAKISILAHHKGNIIVEYLIAFKNIFVRSFHRILPVSEADLLGGLVLGSKSSIDNDFRNDLVTTGTIHIIALSGYNVSIIATTLQRMLANVSWIGPVVGNILGAFGIIAFVSMTGLQSSAIRAGIMALVTIFARSTGRTYDATRALIFAGLLMILWNPKYLVYDVSFQLSFIATLGIIFLTPLLEKKFARFPKTILWILPLREALSVTLGAQIAVMPIILYKMGVLSIIALPANILVLPAIPYAMTLGALGGFLGIFSYGLAYPVAKMTHWLLLYITKLIMFFAHVPYAAVTIQHFSLGLCLASYSVLFFWVYKEFKKQTPD